MTTQIDHRKLHLLLLVGVFTIVGILTYSPILKGKIPFPAQMVTGFPPWESVPERMSFLERGPDNGDAAVIFYPWHYFQASTFRNRELPLWNPHILAGNPFLGDTESALFYPINFIFYVLPLPLAWTMKLVLNVILAGVLTAVFVRSIGGTLPGAISAGIVFALAGNMTTWQSTALTDSVLWLPLICLSVHRLFCIKPDAAAFTLVAVAFAMPVLAGHPETAAQLTFFGIGYALWKSFRSGRGPGAVVGRLGIFATAGLLAIGIASIQILPTLEWLSQISQSLASNWGTLKVHEALSFFSRDIATNPNSSGLWVPEGAAYAGLLPWLLAPLALLSRNKRDAVFFLLLIALAFQVVFGGPAHWLMDHIPVMNGLKNRRFLLVIDFSLAVLAGLGISALSECDLSRKWTYRYIRIAATLCSAFVLAGICLLRYARQADVNWLHGSGSSAAFLVIAYCIVVARTLNWLPAKAFAMAAVGLLSVDLITYAYGYFPFVSPRQVYPDAPVITFLKNRAASPGRVVTLNTYGPNLEMMYGLNGVGGWDVKLRLIDYFLQGLTAPNTNEISIDPLQVAASRDRRLDLLNARYFVTNKYNETYQTLASQPERFSLLYSEGSIQVFENRFALPPALFVPMSAQAVQVLPDDLAQLARVKQPTFDPEREVTLPAMPPGLTNGPNLPESDERAAVEWIETSPNRTELRVTTRKPGVLILSQVFYPGWQVLVDGVQAPILRADYALTGVVLNPGTRLVKFFYSPASFRIGRAVSIASILILFVVLLKPHRWWSRAGNAKVSLK